MADRGETAWSMKALHLIFALSSVALLLSLVWLLWADYDRPWKQYQKQFREIETQRIVGSLASIESAKAGEIARLDAEMAKLAQEEAAMERENAELRRKREELTKLGGVLFDKEQRKKFAKAEEDALRYDVEKQRQSRNDKAWREEDLQKANAKTVASTREYEKALADAKVGEDEVAKILAGVNSRKAEVEGQRRSIDLLRNRLADLTSFSRQQVLNAPMLDFVKPTIEVKKTVLDDLFFDLNFTRKKRIDMCQTCHLPIDSGGYDTHTIVRAEGVDQLEFARQITGMKPVADVAAEGATAKLAEKGKKITADQARAIAAEAKIKKVEVELPQPLRSHPRLDLYLSAASPHPIETFGCSVCHRGSGESVDFVHVDHVPEQFHEEIFREPISEAEKFAKNVHHVEENTAEWEKEHHWHKQHHWDYPMLPASYTEASCLQCHWGSMEIIREAAPTLYRGWRLVEDAGCYSCHKFQGWREMRRQGPQLTNIGSKVTQDWMYGWVTNPKSFRPGTRMPQIFHLENAQPVKPEEGTPEVKAQYDGMSRAFAENVWDDVAIESIVRWLFERSDAMEQAAPPVKGDAAKGKDQFQLAGCLACHELGAGDSKVGKENPYGQFGPNLAGIGSKVTEKWLYNWLKNPHAWWPDTRMPNLRLADDEAANITAYLLEQKNGDWKPVRPPVDPKIAEKQARVFLNSKFSAAETEVFLSDIQKGDLAKVMNPALLPKKQLTGTDAVLFYLGERWISRQGCFSCHTIKGMEDAQAIGAELTEWGSKEVEKLDFGLLEHTYEISKKFGHGKHPYMNLPGSPTAGREPADGLNHESRIEWLAQKLRAPRSYDRGRDKLPLDKWRMPYFAFTEEEIHAISVFVLGMVKQGDVAPNRVMTLDASRRAREDGWHAIRENNCVGCHAFEMERITANVDGRTVIASGLVTVDDPSEDSVTMQLWEPSPDLDPTSPEACQVGQVASFERKQIVSRERMKGGGILPSLWAYYQEKDNKGITEAMALVPPVFIAEGDKVRAPWLVGFLKQPFTLRPQLKVHMPNFALTDAEATAISEFFPYEYARSYSRRLALDARSSIGLTQEKFAVDSKIGGVEKVKSIEAGWPPPPDVFERMKAFVDANRDKVKTPDPPKVLEHVTERDEAYLAQVTAKHSGYFAKAAEIASQSTAGNCYNCHFRGEVKPSGQEAAWAPDLSRVKDRLRPDWVRRWLLNPQLIYPGTSMPMPGNFQNIFNVPRDTQIESLKDLLMNWDRYPNAPTAKISMADEPRK